MILGSVLQEQRLKTIFENPNVFAGCAGVAILLSLGLAVTAEKRTERCLHLSCLLLSSTVFLLAVSRGAMAAIAAAFLLLLLLERGERRRRLLRADGGDAAADGSGQSGGLAGLRRRRAEGADAAAAGGAGRRCGAVRTGHLVGRPLAQRMARRMKTVNIVLLAVLAAAIAAMVLAVSWTGAIHMSAGEQITRGAYLDAGEYTLACGGPAAP